MKKEIFLLSATAVAIIIAGFSACSKTTTNDQENKQWLNQAKVLVPTPCYTWRFTIDDSICHNYFYSEYPHYVCGVDFDCLGYDDPIAPDDPFSIVIPNYSSLNPAISQFYAEVIEKGEITFLEDCPLSNAVYAKLFPDGFLPAGTYPISDRNGDAVIDISSAVKAN